MQAIKLIQLLAAVLPLVHSAVITVEQMFPNAGQGAAKLDAAVSLIESSLQSIGASADQIAALAAPVKGIIGSIVGTLNATGLFKHGTA